MRDGWGRGGRGHRIRGGNERAHNELLLRTSGAGSHCRGADSGFVGRTSGGSLFGEIGTGPDAQFNELCFEARLVGRVGSWTQFAAAFAQRLLERQIVSFFAEYEDGQFASGLACFHGVFGKQQPVITGFDNLGVTSHKPLLQTNLDLYFSYELGPMGRSPKGRRKNKELDAGMERNCYLTWSPNNEVGLSGELLSADRVRGHNTDT